MGSDDDSCKVKIIRNIEKMPLKDYFDVQEVEEEVLSEDAKHAKVIEFVYQVTRKSCDPGEYTGWLQDGKIIEEVIFKSCPTPLGKKQRAAPTDMKTQDRVEKIINDLFEFGVSIEVLFDVDDLVKAKNIPKVTSCLLEIKNMVYTGQGRSDEDEKVITITHHNSLILYHCWVLYLMYK